MSVTLLVTYDISPTAGGPRKRIASLPIGGTAIALGVLMVLGACAKLVGYRCVRRRVALLIMCLSLPILALAACDGEGVIGGSGTGGGGGGGGGTDETTFSMTLTKITADETDTGDDSSIDELILEGTTLTITP